MKVSKIILGLSIAQALCLSLPQTVSCQTETLDMIRYTPPQGWTKTTKEDAVIFVAVDKTNNTFCVLTIHSGTASSGNVEKDFAAEWKNFVVKPHQAEANPKTEKEIKDGWTMTSANAAIEIDGIKSLAILFVFVSGHRYTRGQRPCLSFEFKNPAVEDANFASSFFQRRAMLMPG